MCRSPCSEPDWGCGRHVPQYGGRHAQPLRRSPAERCTSPCRRQYDRHVRPARRSDGDDGDGVDSTRPAPGTTGRLHIQQDRTGTAGCRIAPALHARMHHPPSRTSLRPRTWSDSLARGAQLAGLLLQLGSDVPLPLCYIDNCAEAIRLAAFAPSVRAGAYNVVDFDTPSADEYVARFRREVHPLRVVRLPYSATELLAQLNVLSHRATDGQVPLLLTPYRVRNMWRGHRYDTTRLTMAGWLPPVPTDRALAAAFAAWRDAHTSVSSSPRLKVL